MDYYATTDFYTAAVLISIGYEIQKVTTEGRVKKFHFVDNEDMRSSILSYHNGTLQGNLRDMRNGIEAVKDIVHSE